MEKLTDGEMMLVCNVISCVSFWPEDSCGLTNAMQFNEERLNVQKRAGFAVKEVQAYQETSSLRQRCETIYLVCSTTLKFHDKQGGAVWCQEFTAISGLILALNHQMLLKKQ